MAEHFCAKCHAKLEDQFMFDPQAESYICTKCNTELYKKADSYQILHRCPQCDTVMNSQFFFDPEKEEYRCTRCRSDLIREKGKYVIHYKCPTCRTSLNAQFKEGPQDYWVCRSCHQKLKMDFYKYVKIGDDYFPQEYEEPVMDEDPDEDSYIQDTQGIQTSEIPELMGLSDVSSEEITLSEPVEKIADVISESQGDTPDSILEDTPEPSHRDDSIDQQQEHPDDQSSHDRKPDRTTDREKARSFSIRDRIRGMREDVQYRADVARGVAGRLYKQIVISLKILLILLAFLAVGIGAYEFSLMIPVGYRSSNLLGCKVDAVTSKLESAGFTHIVTKEIEDLDLSHSFQEKLVSSIKIGWADSFDSTSRYPSNFKVTITYHSMMPIAVPFSSRDAKKLNYEEAIEILEEAGFTNIHTEKVTDLITGLLKKNGEVTEILIAGKNFYQEGTEYKPDIEILVKYQGK